MTIQEKAYERRWWILVVLCLSLVVITLDNTILNVALPTLVEKLDASNSQLQWIVDGYTLVFAGLLLTAGSLGDRLGRKGALQIGLAIFGIGSALSAMATSPTQLIITRCIMGIGGAFIMPATLSILTNVFPPEERGRAIGVWAGISGIGIAIGPLLGGYLVDHFSWGSVFTVNLPVVAVAIIAGGLIVPSSKDPDAQKLDPIGAALSIVGLVSLVFGLIEAPQEGWTDPKILAAFAIGALTLAAFAGWELRTDHPMLDVSFFKNPRFSAASTAITLVFFGMFGFSFLLTQYLQFVLGYSPSQAGLRMMPLALTLMVVAPTSSRIVEKVGTKIVVGTGLTLVSVALLLNTGLAVDSAYVQVVWRMMLLAVGMGLVMAPATESIMGSLPLGKAGVGSAVNDTTRQVGGALGVAIVGSVLSSVYGTKIADFMGEAGLPAKAIDGARDGLGSALAIAGKVGGPEGAAIAGQARAAFVEALHGGAIVASVAAAVGAVVVIRSLPSHAPTIGDEPQDSATDPTVSITVPSDATTTTESLDPASI